jgi:hypothetical protein
VEVLIKDATAYVSRRYPNIQQPPNANGYAVPHGNSTRGLVEIPPVYTRFAFQTGSGLVNITRAEIKGKRVRDIPY